jgi:hypothetical protein
MIFVASISKGCAILVDCCLGTPPDLSGLRSGYLPGRGDAGALSHQNIFDLSL